MTTCVEQMTCLPEKPFDIFKFYNYQYGLPDAVVLGMLLGILVAGIYLWTRSINLLVILGVYCLAIVSATWAADGITDEVTKTIWYVMALGIASLVVILFLKVTRE